MGRTSKARSGAPPPVASADKYRHEPLDLSSKAIRIFRILPGPKNSTPKCQMRVVNPGEPGETHYVCLSYVWGPPDEGKPILVNGRALPVRQNLYEFLLTARGMKIREWLWVDAISIDQDNVAEKNHQVKEMAEIYQSAKYVLIWPGRSTQRLKCIEFVSTLKLGLRSGRGSYYDAIMSKLLFWLRHKFCHRDMDRVSQLDYWNRLWVIQEFLLAKDIFFIFGRHKIPGELLVSIDNDTRYYKKWTGVDDKSKMSVLLAQRRMRRTSLHHLVSQEYYLDLSKPLEIFCTRNTPYTTSPECVDIKDRVFGLVGLVEQSKRPPVRYELDREAILFQLMLHYSYSDPGVSLRLFEALGAALELKAVAICTHVLSDYGLRSMSPPEPRDDVVGRVLILLYVLDGDVRYSDQPLDGICTRCKEYREYARRSDLLHQPTKNSLWMCEAVTFRSAAPG